MVAHSTINQTDRVRAPVRAAENLEVDHVCRTAPSLGDTGIRILDPPLSPKVKLRQAVNDKNVSASERRDLDKPLFNFPPPDQTRPDQTRAVLVSLVSVTNSYLVLVMHSLYIRFQVVYLELH